MSLTKTSGIYGKLPGYGDFIFRNLKASFINPWDTWLQNYISVTKEQLGNNWLDIYLTSPIWRFVFSPGVIDTNVYAGIMMPSVDRVGRYFPISVVNVLPGSVTPVELLLEDNGWFNAMEVQCLAALNGELDADELVANVSGLEVKIKSKYQATMDLGGSGPMAFQLGACDPGQIQTLLPYYLNASLSSALSSFSVWMTSGSEYIPPILFSSQGLPQVGSAASMLDGRWKERSWKTPYTIELI